MYFFYTVMGTLLQPNGKLGSGDAGFNVADFGALIGFQGACSL